MFGGVEEFRVKCVLEVREGKSTIDCAEHNGKHGCIVWWECKSSLPTCTQMAATWCHESQ